MACSSAKQPNDGYFNCASEVGGVDVGGGGQNIGDTVLNMQYILL